jgi:hypothetical protein
MLPTLLLMVALLLAPATATPVASDHWRPAQGLDWQMQLLGEIDLSHGRDVFFLDLFDATDADLAALRERGTRVVCYFSAGSYEDWRADAGAYPDAILGEPLDGWPGERWLDVRSPDLRPIIEARLDVAVQRGCDGVDPDNVDGYANRTGFDLTADDQLSFNRWLADAAHARGLAVGLKNDTGQAAELVEWFDWQVNEQCVEYEECGTLAPFIDAGKPVFGLEYPVGDDQSLPDRAGEVCPTANAAGHDTLVKPLDLTAPLVRCRDAA